ARSGLRCTALRRCSARATGSRTNGPCARGRTWECIRAWSSSVSFVALVSAHCRTCWDQRHRWPPDSKNVPVRARCSSPPTHIGCSEASCAPSLLERSDCPSTRRICRSSWVTAAQQRFAIESVHGLPEPPLVARRLERAHLLDGWAQGRAGAAGVTLLD